MNGIECDRCGKGLLLDSDVRYIVTVEVKAAYDPMEITRDDLKRDFEAEMRRLLARMEKISEEEAQEQVYKKFTFDLCPDCRKRYIRNPLGR